MSNVDRLPYGVPAWFDLMTSEPEKARAFYGAIFGWKYEIGPAETGHYAICRIRDRNAAGIGQKPPSAPFPSAWNVYLLVESVDSTIARIKEDGGQVMMPAMDVMEEGRMAFCADPTGAAFGLWQPKRHQGTGVTNEHGALAWAEAYTRDGQKARAFYAKVFGLETGSLEQMPYFTLHKNGKPYAGIMQMDDKFPKDVPPHWMPYFAVDATDEAAKEIGEHGGHVRMGPFDSEYGRIAIASDPAGAAFAIIQLSEKALRQ